MGRQLSRKTIQQLSPIASGGQISTGNRISLLRRVERRLPLLNSEHGILDLSAGADLSVGARISMVPRYHGSVVVAYDRFVCVRKNRVECIWDIIARGCHE